MLRIDIILILIFYLRTFPCEAPCEEKHSTEFKQTLIEDDSYNGSITDIDGILVGHSSKAERLTGCTVIICNTTCTAGVDVRGAAPGTRETDLLDPINAISNVNAIVLSGGSVFGLDSASGVVQCLVEKKMGHPARDRLVPIVPAAVLYDLSVGNDSFIVPDAQSGYSACMTADNGPVAEGNVGAGSGASIGKILSINNAMKAGLGSTSITVRDAITNATVTVGALVAVNAAGDIYKNGKLIAGAQTPDGKHLLNTVQYLLSMSPNIYDNFPVGTATTLACIVTDATLTKAQAKKISQMAHDGFARAINPVHTMLDGDVIFTLATGASPVSNINLIGMMAAETVERAIIRAVEKATGVSRFPSIHELNSNSTGQKTCVSCYYIILSFFLYLNSCQEAKY
ncbi:hypothetical protein I4U23_019892 [Adineta vaga]|nr:hypothetical protein I4U23_019892 [Adineta vaga]